VAQRLKRAFEEEALVHLDELYRVARRLTASGAEAEDLVQETCLQAWRSFTRFERGTNCRAWLFKILFRTLGARRRNLRRELEMFDGQPLDDACVPAPGPAEPAAIPHQIERAFASLPVAFTSVLLLVDVEGLSYREASDALDVPIGTVMSRLHRARRLLRDRLSPARLLLVHARNRS
jgi:RNA polymerase sigma-70 factor (ECF subfamily)